jgi:tetratricopeptide (TPR) repeat protein
LRAALLGSARLGLAMLCCALLAQNAARADAPEIEIARGHSRRAAAHFQAGQFAQAAAEFELARKELPIAEIDYNLGRSYEGTGDIDRALEAYRRYLARPLSHETRDEVQDRVRLLEAASPRAHARVEHARQVAHARARWRALMPAAATVGALAVAAGVSSGVLFARAHAMADELALGCPPHCEPGLYDRAHATNTASVALFAIAIGAAAVDAGLWGAALHFRTRAATEAPP